MKRLFVFVLVAVALMVVSFAPTSAQETCSVQFADGAEGWFECAAVRTLAPMQTGSVSAEAACDEPHDYIWGPLDKHIDLTIVSSYGGTDGTWVLFRLLPDGGNTYLSYASTGPYGSIAIIHGEMISLRGSSELVEILQGKEYSVEMWKGDYPEEFAIEPTLTELVAESDFTTPLCNKLFLPAVFGG